MRTPKYDWPKLKSEFLAGDIPTAKGFIESKGMKSINFLAQTKGWTEERKKFREEAEIKAREKMLDDEVEDVTAVRRRQARLAKFMQLKGAAELQNMSVESIEDARKLVQTGLQEERKALGMEGNSNHQSLTQININAGPKTNIDRAVESMTYEELLGFIAELKRQRARLSAPEDTPVSPGEIEEGEVL